MQCPAQALAEDKYLIFGRCSRLGLWPNMLWACLDGNVIEKVVRGSPVGPTELQQLEEDRIRRFKR